MIYKFYTTWCNPCQTLTKKLEQLKIPHTSINAEENQHLVEQYNIRTVPTLINTTTGDTLVGNPEPQDILNFCKQI